MEDMMPKIYTYIEKLFSIVKPQKLFMMAIDGEPGLQLVKGDSPSSIRAGRSTAAPRLAVYVLCERDNPEHREALLYVICRAPECAMGKRPL